MQLQMDPMKTVSINDATMAGERMRLSGRAWSYLKSALLLHCITMVEIALLIAAAPGLLPTGADSWVRTAGSAMLMLFLVSLPVFSQLDARCRYQNYRRVKRQFVRYGFDARILRPLLKSRCQRDAAQVAANETGYGEICREYYRECGYCWYHVLPDFLFTDPLFLASRRFWQSTFFLKTYHPRSDLRNRPSI